jgi:uncharacterized membrane protein YjgN (DUF898 family)
MKIAKVYSNNRCHHPLREVAFFFSGGGGAAFVSFFLLSFFGVASLGLTGGTEAAAVLAECAFEGAASEEEDAGCSPP